MSNQTASENECFVASIVFSFVYCSVLVQNFTLVSSGPFVHSKSNSSIKKQGLENIQLNLSTSQQQILQFSVKRKSSLSYLKDHKLYLRCKTLVQSTHSNIQTLSVLCSILYVQKEIRNIAWEYKRDKKHLTQAFHLNLNFI